MACQGVYARGVEPPQELPDLPQNAALLEFLREQASPPSGPGDYTLGSWQLHTHPDLIGRSPPPTGSRYWRVRASLPLSPWGRTISSFVPITCLLVLTLSTRLPSGHSLAGAGTSSVRCKAS